MIGAFVVHVQSELAAKITDENIKEVSAALRKQMGKFASRSFICERLDANDQNLTQTYWDIIERLLKISVCNHIWVPSTTETRRYIVNGEVEGGDNVDFEYCPLCDCLHPEYQKVSHE